MSRTSIIILEDTLGQTNPVGQPVNGAGYYGTPTSNHTIAVYNNNFTGRLYIEATLTKNATEADWFDIDLDPSDSTSYVEFTNSTDIIPFNFKGNYVCLRARVDRTYLTTPEDPAHGNITKILLNI